MLRAEKNLNAIIRFFSLMAIAALLYGCTSPMQKTAADADHDNTPYGAWYLLNPQDMQENLINGGLIVCRKDSREKGYPVCKANGYTMTLIEKNFGYGCADYVSAGRLEFNSSDSQWYLISGCADSQELERMRVQRDGEQLHVYSREGKKLVFERSTPKAIREKACLACELTEHHPEHGF